MLRLLALSFLALLCQAQNAYTIAGHVVRHLDQRPVKGAQVSLAMVTEREREVSVISGADGEFTFQGVPAAKYQLHVTDHGASQRYQQTEYFATAIVTGPNLDTEHILFTLDSPASIIGTVVDEYNEPIQHIQVYLFHQALTLGKARTQNHGQTNTDTGGNFHFRGLEPGTYYVAVVGQPWYAQMGNPAQAHSELDVTYPVTYYGGANSAEGAAPLKLEEGQKAQVQIGLHAVPALHIKIDGMSNERRGPQGMRLEQSGPGGTIIHVPVAMANSEIMGIAPGSYRLITGTDVRTVALTGDSELPLATQAETDIKGRVTAPGGDAGAPARVTLRDEVSGNARAEVIQPDGTFEVKGLIAGHYVLGLVGLADTYVAKVEAKGAHYADGVLDVQTGNQVELEITAGHGLKKVEGKILREQKALAGAMVLLIPQERNQGRPTLRDQSDSDGTFTIAGVAPGRYTLVAIDDGHGLAYAEPAAIAPYLEHGQVVDVPLSKDAVVEVQSRLK